MKLVDYWKSLRPGLQRDGFAASCGTSTGYMQLVVGGFKNPGESLCMRIEAATDGAVTCEELRDDVPWHILRGNAPRQPSEAA